MGRPRRDFVPGPVPGRSLAGTQHLGGVCSGDPQAQSEASASYHVEAASPQEVKGGQETPQGSVVNPRKKMSLKSGV